MTQQTAGGRIVPFPITAAYVRRKAQENRREGRILEAAELFRKGSEMENGTDCLMDLAQTLSLMGCPEQALSALERLIIQTPQDPQAYYEMTLNQMRMGRQEAALDCAANCLALDPEGPYAETLQEMMEHIAQPEGVPPSNRQRILVRRGAAFQAAGQEEKALKAFKRALKASRKTPAMYCALGFLYLEQKMPAKALSQARQALKKDPEHLPGQCLRCLAADRMGHQTLARQMLENMSRSCYQDEQISLLCRTARQMGGEDQALRFLKRQLRRSPYSIPLLEEAALSHAQLGQMKDAMEKWRRILRIDPVNDSARVCLRMAEAGCYEAPRQAGMIPPSEMLGRLQCLTLALSQGPERFLQEDARTPRWEDVVRWAFTLPYCGLHQPLLQALNTWPPERASGLLKPLLLSDGVGEEVRRQIVYYLILSGEKGPFMMRYGNRITQVEAQETASVPQGWKRFLQLFLMECRDVPNPSQAVAFAQRCWLAFTPAQQMEALGERAFGWVMAVKLLALENMGFVDLENELAAHLPISVRRVERLMDRIERQLALKEALTDETDRL